MTEFVNRRQSDLKQEALALKDKLVSLNGFKGSNLNQNMNNSGIGNNYLEAKISETVN